MSFVLGGEQDYADNVTSMITGDIETFYILFSIALAIIFILCILIFILFFSDFFFSLSYSVCLRGNIPPLRLRFTPEI